MELGKEAKEYRKQFLDQSMPLEDVHILHAIEFAWERSVYQWAHVVVPALVAYKNTHGHLNIAQSFVVPSVDPWPEKTWELKLGTVINTIRTSSYFVKTDPGRRQWLQDEGFVFDVLKEKWEDAQRALEQYRDLHGDLDIPQSYKVPAEEPWPEGMRGVALGIMANSIRCRGYFVSDNPERKQWLEERGFRFETKDSSRMEDDNRWDFSVLPALAAYRGMHGDLNVPQPFVVPSEEPWPEESWGLSLGKVTNAIRSTSTYTRNNPERLQQLEDIGFVFDDLERWWEETTSALKLYHEQHGHMGVPRSFVVPREDSWPDETWDKRLGETVHNMRSANGYYARDIPERREWLEEHGFRWKLRQSTAERARASFVHYGLALDQDGSAPVAVVV
jgi:hypothetical protein